MNIPPELYRGVAAPRRCSYLPTETAQLESRLFRRLRPEQLEHLVERGWRRFSSDLFRPACPACTQCRPIRVDVRRFTPSKSQRRTLRRNAHVRVELWEPGVTSEHVRLYNAWHEDMSERRGWRPQQVDENMYRLQFLASDIDTLRELRYFDGDRLLGVGLIDLLPKSLSSAYFYHDPEWRDLGPGTFSGLVEIDFALRSGRSHVYFGFWIAECPSMSYKNRFQPYELLERFVDDHEAPVWVERKPSGEE